MPLPTDIDQHLAELVQLQAALFGAMRPLLGKPKHLLTPHEDLALGACWRAMVACDDYADAVRAQRYGSAMTQVRVQLDSCLRFFASFLVADPDGFSRRVRGGTKQINRMRDRDGKTMTDGYLARRISRHRPPEQRWEPRLHKFASDFVHFSGAIMAIAEAEMVDWDETTRFEDINLSNRRTSEEDWEESIGHFQGCTLLFMRLLEGWLADRDPG